MKFLLTLFAIYTIALSAVVCGSCIVRRRSQTIRYECRELTNLNSLGVPKTNTTEIKIWDSQITNIPGHSFAAFGATLKTLDLHESGIESIDPQAFIGLTSLEKLILWGNKLRSVPWEWFVNTPSLRTLDLSFNAIQNINDDVFRVLPYLENFYFDYNQLKFIAFGNFPHMGNLKRVKFGKNPMHWAYRARLTWQLENQRVDYSDDWEDWGWMNVAIRECIEKGQGELPSETILDCLVGGLLDFTHDAAEELKSEPRNCLEDVKRLTMCVKSPNATISDNMTIRTALQLYANYLPTMIKAQGKFSI